MSLRIGFGPTSQKMDVHMHVLVGVAVLALAPGLPLALHLAARDEETEIRPSALLYDALLVGLAVLLVAGTLLMRVGAFEPRYLLGVAAGLTLLAAVPLFPRRHELRIRAPSLSLPTVGAAAILAVALLLRRNPIEFVFLTGDMGEYVSSARRVAAGVSLLDTFPHLFAVFLALPASLFGWVHTVAALPVAGMLLVGGVLRLGGLLRISPVPRLAVALAAAIGVAPVWFSLFPVSEALYAPFLLGMIVFLVRAHLEGRPRIGYVAGALLLPLGLLRGNALLLVPLLLLYLLVTAMLRSRHEVDVAFVISGLAGTAVAYAYDVGFLPGYYVGKQLVNFLPGSIFWFAHGVGLLESDWVLAGSTALGLLAVYGIARFARDQGRRVRETVRANVVSWTPLALLVAAGVAVFLLGPTGVAGGLIRQGWFIVLVGGLGLAGGAIFVEDGSTKRLLLIGALIAAAFAVLHAIRVPEDRGHGYFLYWDRYLYSEVYPAALAGGLVGLGAAWERCRSLFPKQLSTILAAVVLAAPLPMLEDSLFATEQHLFGDAFHVVEELHARTSPAEVPIVYDGYERVPGDWGFPNTYRAIARPLVTYGHTILNLPPEPQPFERDPTPTLEDVRGMMEEEGVERVFLLRALDPDDRRTAVPAELELQRRGMVTHEIPLLRQDPGRRARWREVTLAVEVIEVRLSG